MPNTKSNNPSCLALLFHVFMTLITGGLWFIGLVIWYILKKTK